MKLICQTIEQGRKAYNVSHILETPGVYRYVRHKFATFELWLYASVLYIGLFKNALVMIWEKLELLQK